MSKHSISEYFLWMSQNTFDRKSKYINVGVVRQQAITWASVDPDLSRRNYHMASLDHYWLIRCRGVLVMFDLQPVPWHYNDVIMGAIASQITSLTIVYSTVFSDTDQRKHQSSASLPFLLGIHRGPVNSPHKWPVTRKMFPFDDVIMIYTHDLLYFVLLWTYRAVYLPISIKASYSIIPVN